MRRRVSGTVMKTALYVLGLLAAVPATALGQCVMCGTIGNGADDPLVRGMFASIMFMVFMPATLTMVVGGWFVYRHRSGLSDEPGDAPPESIHIDSRRD